MFNIRGTLTPMGKQIICKWKRKCIQGYFFLLVLTLSHPRISQVTGFWPFCWFQPVKTISFCFLTISLFLSLSSVFFYLLRPVCVFLCLFSITIASAPICSTSNKDRWEQRWGIGWVSALSFTTLSHPLALFLYARVTDCYLAICWAETWLPGQVEHT